MPLENRATFGRVSELREATGILFRETDSDYHLDWHNAPRRQFIARWRDRSAAWSS